MKKYINLSTIKFLTLTLGLALIVSACEKEEDALDLTLSESTVELYVGDAATVTIQSGNGGYEVTSSDPEVAEVDVTGTSVRVQGVAKGTATITVTDGAGKSKTIAVTVNTAIIDASTPRFRWGTTYPLTEANGWAVTVLADKVSITRLTDKKQFILSWSGGFSQGEKSGASLETVEGSESNSETLSFFEVQSAPGDETHSIVFNNGSQSGELVVAQ